VLGRASDLLVDTEKVGKDIDGGNVGVGRNDEMVAFESVVIISESRSNCVSDDDSTNVRVNEEISLSGRLMILMAPRDDWNMAKTTSFLAEIVTLMVALEDGRVVRNILKARNWKNI